MVGVQVITIGVEQMLQRFILLGFVLIMESYYRGLMVTTFCYVVNYQCLIFLINCASTGYAKNVFTWEKYLQETASSAIPFELFTEVKC